MRFERYVAIGDSTTEGLDDPDGNGSYRGWANRLAERIAEIQGSVLYANLAVRGRSTRQIKLEQLAPAIAMKPNVATVVAGMNDLLRWEFDAEEVAADVGEMQRALVEHGATVITFTIPDISRVMPIARGISPRTSSLNHALRRVTAQTGALLLDLAAHDVASDPRLWSRDRLHANADGHARIADALAYSLGLPGTDDAWMRPLPPLPPPTIRARVWRHLEWGRDHFLPWVWRRMHGRSSGDGITAKRPALAIFNGR